LIEYSNWVVVLRSADGRRISLTINKLAQADQVMVTKWHAENSKSTGGFTTASTNKKDFEVVFVSSDRSSDAQMG